MLKNTPVVMFLSIVQSVGSRRCWIYVLIAVLLSAKGIVFHLFPCKDVPHLRPQQVKKVVDYLGRLIDKHSDVIIFQVISFWFVSCENTVGEKQDI